MKYLDEFHDPALAERLLGEIRGAATRHWAIMEVCGGQTHSIIRNGIDQLLPDQIELVHGPGCPVCVTPLGMIDRALAIAARPEVILCSFGDMLRVPGSTTDLFGVKAAGGDVRVVYSPLDAIQIADERDDPEVAAQKADKGALLRKCSDALSPMHREIIDLVYFHEMSVREASEVLGVPVDDGPSIATDDGRIEFVAAGERGEGVDGFVFRSATDADPVDTEICNVSIRTT